MFEPWRQAKVKSVVSVAALVLFYQPTGITAMDLRPLGYLEREGGL